VSSHPHCTAEESRSRSLEIGQFRVSGCTTPRILADNASSGGSNPRSRRSTSARRRQPPHLSDRTSEDGGRRLRCWFAPCSRGRESGYQVEEARYLLGKCPDCSLRLGPRRGLTANSSQAPIRRQPGHTKEKPDVRRRANEVPVLRRGPQAHARRYTRNGGQNQLRLDSEPAFVEVRSDGRTSTTPRSSRPHCGEADLAALMTDCRLVAADFGHYGRCSSDAGTGAGTYERDAGPGGGSTVRAAQQLAGQREPRQGRRLLWPISRVRPEDLLGRPVGPHGKSPWRRWGSRRSVRWRPETSGADQDVYWGRDTWLGGDVRYSTVGRGQKKVGV